MPRRWRGARRCRPSCAFLSLTKCIQAHIGQDVAVVPAADVDSCLSLCDRSASCCGIVWQARAATPMSMFDADGTSMDIKTWSEPIDLTPFRCAASCSIRVAAWLHADGIMHRLSVVASV